MNNVDVLLSLLLSLANQMGPISALISKANGEGRDISDEELDALFLEDDVARQRLVDALAAAKARE